MSPTDSPLAINGEVSDAPRSADGAITGFVVRDGNWSSVSTPVYQSNRTVHRVGADFSWRTRST
jgi:hypothetical protein